MSRILFAADIHLRPRSPEHNRPFLDFLEEECEALYLLGDVFDYWIGPKHLRSVDYREELEALRKKSSRCKVFFIHGNRDYFVDEKFARATGVAILGERARLELGGRTVLLAHGDFIYNTNAKYAAYRALMRSRPVADLFLAIPAAAGKALARGFRKVSKKTTPAVAWSRDDLVARAQPIFDLGNDVLICGHIHAPQQVTVEARERRRDIFILGDWDGGTRDYVEFEEGRGFRLVRPMP